MIFRNGIKQSFRAPVRMLAVLLIATLICGFLSIGLNLRQAAQENIQLLKEEFDVVALPTFRGSLDYSGNLTLDTTGRYAGFLMTYAQNFDKSVFENATGVKDVLIHKQVGVFVEGDQVLPGSVSRRNNHDVFIFTYTGNKPAEIGRKPTETSMYVNSNTITFDWSARGFDTCAITKEGLNITHRIELRLTRQHWAETGIYQELGVDEMWPEDEEGKKTGTFILQPGQQYIACGNWLFQYAYADGEYLEGQDQVHTVQIYPDQGHSMQRLTFENNGWNAELDPRAFEVSYPCILPYTEDFWETDAGKYYQDAIDICRINANSLTAVATPDLSLYVPFQDGEVYISEGRTFEPDDYENGNKVCLVSKYIADHNGWEIGDKLDLSFYKANYGFTGLASQVTSYYEPFVEHYDINSDTYSLERKDLFCDTGTYEIIGFYDGNVTVIEYGTSMQYTQDTGIDRRVVIVPEKSVQNLPDVPLSQYNTTILLDDEQILYFMADMEASGLLEQQLGQYQVSFEIYDQGLGQIKQSLRQLDTVSRLTLYLACAAAVAVVILLSVLTIIQNRRQIATLRSLGVRKHQIPAAVLSGVLLVCLLGACLGGYIGYKASDKVAGYILETAQQDMADTSFSAMLAGDTEAKEEAYTIAIQSRPQAAAFAAAAVMLALTALSCTLTLIEARKSPMLTLGARE